MLLSSWRSCSFFARLAKPKLKSCPKSVNVPPNNALAKANVEGLNLMSCVKILSVRVHTCHAFLMIVFVKVDSSKSRHENTSGVDSVHKRVAHFNSRRYGNDETFNDASVNDFRIY